MVIRATIALRERDGWASLDNDNRKARRDIEASIYEAVNDAAKLHGVRIAEVRIAEGRPSTRTKGATNDE